jgi:uncharacterized membrane protein YkgB
MIRFVEKCDHEIICALRKVSIPFGRLAIFVVFFWFGALKLIGTSPANPLVSDLLEKTLPFMTFDTFIILFAIYEMIIGIIFLIPRMERVAIALLLPHMVTTFMPLILLPAVTWSAFLTPTLEGQYIIKNLVIIAVAMGIAAHLHPMHLVSKKK